MALSSTVKIGDDFETIKIKFNEFKEQLTEKDKQIYIKKVVEKELSFLKDNLHRHMFLTHTTDEQKQAQINHMEPILIYEAILEDFEED